jgi:lipopolysaccharide biosynthesis glycosyltransferase
MKRFVCTYFDINYLGQGMALYHSLAAYNESNFTFYVLGLDDATSNYFIRNPKKNLVCIPLNEYIKHFNIDINRFASRRELYFSITPSWCLYLLHQFKEIDTIAYLDADVFFFQSLEAIYSDLGTYSIGVARQRASWFKRLLFKHSGYFNVGVNLFRNNEAGLKCLTEWKELCDSWTSDNPNNPLPFFSDQIYLDDWPARYPQDLRIFENKGINLAPVHMSGYQLTKKNDVYLVEGTPVVVYHFMQLTKTTENNWHTNSASNFFRMDGVVENMYRQYINILEFYQVKNTILTLNHSKSYLREIGKKCVQLFIKENIKINPTATKNKSSTT